MSRAGYVLKKLPKVIAFLVGVVALVAGGLVLLSGANIIDLGPLIDAAGYDYVVVGAVAAVGLVLGLLFAFHGRAGTVRQCDTPDAEGAQSVPCPGDDFDDLVRDATRWRGKGERERVRERLRAAAVDAVVKSENCSRYEAQNRVDGGAWTADSYASAVTTEGSGSLPLLTRARYAVGGSAFEVAVSRAVDEIEGLAGDTDD